jgi:hypothetical protein
MVEIYNETIIDLLAAGDGDGGAAGGAGDDHEGGGGGGGGGGLKIKAGPAGNHLPDAVSVRVTCAAEVAALMARGAAARSVGRTNANEHSSRSHSLLLIELSGANAVSDSRTAGRLVLVDLAGSERVSKSGAEGTRLKEAQNINKSLSALGDVINALTTKAPHVPVRNSKLTYLLQDSLSKDNKVMMIVQVGPTASSRGETLCSLQFAAPRVQRGAVQRVPARQAEEREVVVAEVHARALA